jgi:hypothetical protein
MKTRSERRHQHKRMLKKTLEFVKNIWGRNFSKETLDEIVKTHAETRAMCSCWMCGNPRRHQKDKLTIQEKRAKDNEKFD